MKLDIPAGAAFIIERLESAGYRADVVGGSVRDALLGRRPDDFDITTSARPEAIKALFSDVRTVDTGLKHGTVTVVLDDGSYEVTTYRIDGEYTDSRHPDGVVFTDDITLDLARRDFTVNAMAYSDRHGLTDKFFGVADLRAGIIRAVGDPVRRLDEDALRIMRAIRFSSKLGFKIEDSLRAAIFLMKDRLALVSVERIYTEWIKLLSGVGAYEVLSDYEEIITGIFPELRTLSLPDRGRFCESSALPRMLSLFAINGGVEEYECAMRRMRTDNETRAVGAQVLRLYPIFASHDEREIRLAYTKYPMATLKLASSLAVLLTGEGEQGAALLDGLCASGIPSAVTELAVGGEDIMSLGARGAEIGRVLSLLLSACALGELENTRESLLTYASTLI